MRKVKFGKRTAVVAAILVLCVGLAYGAVVHYLSQTATVETTIESPIVVSGTILYGKGVLRWSEDDGIEACTLAADRLVALRSETDHGWDWDVTNATGHSVNASATNLYGVTALGLIDAYLLTDNESYLVAAEKVGDFITYGDPNKGDFYNGIPPDYTYYWGFSQDYRFLMRLAAVSGDSKYSDYALAAWEWQKINRGEYYAYGSQENMYNFFYGWTDPDSHGFAAWQSADFGLAALEMGDMAWATEMASVVASHISEITPEGDVYEIIGWGRALEFLSTIDPLTYATQINDLINKLKEAQALDGHWDGGNTEGAVQDTAYAILGLLKAGELDMAQKAAYWLVVNQGYGDISGGWLNEVTEDGETSYVEYSETTSEALQAIVHTLMAFEPARDPVSFDTSTETSVILGELKAGDTIIAIGTERNLANNPVTSVVAVVIPAPSE